MAFAGALRCGGMGACLDGRGASATHCGGSTRVRLVGGATCRCGAGLVAQSLQLHGRHRRDCRSRGCLRLFRRGHPVSADRSARGRLRATPVGRRRGWISVLELPSGEDLHGRCGKRVPGDNAGRACAAGGLDSAAVDLELAHSFGYLYCGCHVDSVAPVGSGRACVRGAPQPCVSARVPQGRVAPADHVGGNRNQCPMATSDGCSRCIRLFGGWCCIGDCVRPAFGPGNRIQGRGARLGATGDRLPPPLWRSRAGQVRQYTIAHCIR
ncbi:Uncharacterised protein [Achromobacter xylosoxidans]|nr:Uncharacterised protein [Achromobacter xylosoxidans]